MRGTIHVKGAMISLAEVAARVAGESNKSLLHLGECEMLFFNEIEGKEDNSPTNFILLPLAVRGVTCDGNKFPTASPTVLFTTNCNDIALANEEIHSQGMKVQGCASPINKKVFVLYERVAPGFSLLTPLSVTSQLHVCDPG